jgi:hypothetical protein
MVRFPLLLVNIYKFYKWYLIISWCFLIIHLWINHTCKIYVGVIQNRVPQNVRVSWLITFPYQNKHFMGTPIFRHTHILICRWSYHVPPHPSHAPLQPRSWHAEVNCAAVVDNPSLKKWLQEVAVKILQGFEQKWFNQSGFKLSSIDNMGWTWFYQPFLW